MVRCFLCNEIRSLVVLLVVLQVKSQPLPEGLYCGQDNCYDILEVTRDSTKSEIAKAYRLLARKWHPDMHKSQKDKEIASEMFRKIATAYETLKDEDTKKDYDYMLDHPDEYYFNYYKYYRRRMAPQVDVRVVIVVTISIISVLQYLSAYNNYRSAIDYLATVPKYQLQAKEIAKNDGLLDDKKKRDRRKTKEEIKQEEDAVIKMIIRDKMDLRGGYRKPSVFDTLWLQLVFLPYHIILYVTWCIKWWFKYTIGRKEYDDSAKQYLIRRNMGVSSGQWEALEDNVKEEYMELELWKKENFTEWKTEQEEEMKVKLAQNSRYKMHRRYLKKGGAGQMTFGPE